MGVISSFGDKWPRMRILKAQADLGNPASVLAYSLPWSKSLPPVSPSFFICRIGHWSTVLRTE
jgi:hypothetical protein